MAKGETREAELARKGVLFAMRGGPYDGSIHRVWPIAQVEFVRDSTRHHGKEYGPVLSECVWDEYAVVRDGEVVGRYVRPDDVDPLMKWSGKFNKRKDNGPYLAWVPRAEEEGAASAALLNDTGGNPMTTEVSAA